MSASEFIGGALLFAGGILSVYAILLFLFAVTTV